MKGLTLTIREQSGIAVLNGVMEGKVSVAEAARLNGVRNQNRRPPQICAADYSSPGKWTGYLGAGHQ